jgi:hypothetical protein
MAAIKDGGPAFPNAPHSALAVYGMTLRDYFAAQAMAATISNRREMALVNDVAESNEEDDTDVVARWAYVYADAMLKAREGK